MRMMPSFAAVALTSAVVFPTQAEVTTYVSADNTTATLKVEDKATWVGGAAPATRPQEVGSQTALQLSSGTAFGTTSSAFQYFALPAYTNQWLDSVTGDARRYLKLGYKSDSTLRGKAGGTLYLRDTSGFYGSMGYGAYGHGVSVTGTDGLKRLGVVFTPTDELSPVVRNLEYFGRVHVGANSTVGHGKLVLQNLLGQGFFDLNLKPAFDNDDEGSSKTYAGEIEIVSSPGPRGYAFLGNGQLTLDGAPSDMPNEPVAGAALHFDASVAASVQTDADGVTRWNDLTGSGIYATPHLNRATYVQHAAGAGLHAVDFGVYKCESSGKPGYNPSAASIATYGEPAALVLSEPVGRVCELFVVWREKQPSNAAANPVGSAVSGDHHCFWRRESTNVPRLIANWTGHTTTTFSDGEVRWDGQRIPPSAEVYDINMGFHVQSVAVPSDLDYGTVRYLGMNCADGTNYGGSQVAEVLAYTRTLTADERRQVNAYLMKKWRSGVDAVDYDLGAVVGSTYIGINVPEGRTARIRTIRFAGTSGLEIRKSGAGNLEIGNIFPATAALTVNEGTVAVAAPSVPSAALAADPLLHFDATQIATADTETVEETTYVNVWRSLAGSAVARPLPLEQDKGHKGELFPRATLVTDAASGKQVVDFGAYDSTNYSQGADPKESKGSAYKIEENDASLKGFSGSGCEAFAVVKLKHNNAQFFSRYFNTMYCQRSSGVFVVPGTIADLNGALWTVDGVPMPANAWSTQNTTRFNVIHFSSSNPITLDGFASDRGYQLIGGLQIAEFVTYERQLSAEERRSTTQYLMQKWLGKDHPDAAAQPTGFYAAGGAVIGEITSGDPKGVTIAADASTRIVSGISAQAGANVTVRLPAPRLETLLGAARLRLDATVAKEITYAKDAGVVPGNGYDLYAPDGKPYVYQWNNVNTLNRYMRAVSTNGEAKTHQAFPDSRNRYSLSWPTVRDFTVNGVTRPYVDMGGLSWFFWKNGSAGDSSYNDPNGAPDSNGIGTNCTDSAWMQASNGDTFKGQEYHVVHGDAHLEVIQQETSRRCQYYRNAIFGRTNTQKAPNRIPGRRGYTRSTAEGSIDICGQLFDAANNAAFAATDLPDDEKPRIWVDNETSDYTYNPRSDEETVHVYTFIPTNATVKADSSQFEWFYTLAGDSYCGYGGARYGEILIYSATNSAEDRAYLDAYLLKKWKGVGSVKVALGNVALAAGSNVGLESSYDFGSEFSADAFSGGGTVSLASGNMFSAKALSVNVFSRTEVEKLTVGGTFAFPAEGTLTVSGSVLPKPGSYTLLEATTLQDAANFANWTVGLDLPDTKGRASVAVDGNKLVLTVASPGLLVIIH